MESAKLVAAWRDIIDGPEKSWVLFEHGTCVVLMEPGDDLAAQATALLRENGPVYPGSSFGDFATIELEARRGWVVTCHHTDILTYVSPDEVGPEHANDLVVGLLGRSRRGQDAEDLNVIHVEDRRSRA
jgi:hypothetical protein